MAFMEEMDRGGDHLGKIPMASICSEADLAHPKHGINSLRMNMRQGWGNMLREPYDFAAAASLAGLESLSRSIMEEVRTSLTKTSTSRYSNKVPQLQLS